MRGVSRAGRPRFPEPDPLLLPLRPIVRRLPFPSFRLPLVFPVWPVLGTCRRPRRLRLPLQVRHERVIADIQDLAGLALILLTSVEHETGITRPHARIESSRFK